MNSYSKCEEYITYHSRIFSPLSTRVLKRYNLNYHISAEGESSETVVPGATTAMSSYIGRWRGRHLRNVSASSHTDFSLRHHSLSGRLSAHLCGLSNHGDVPLHLQQDSICRCNNAKELFSEFSPASASHCQSSLLRNASQKQFRWTFPARCSRERE